MAEDDSNNKSKYNEAAQKLERMGDIKKGIINCRIVNNIPEWVNLIISFRAELNERMSEKEIEVCNMFENLIQAALMPTILNSNHPFNNSNKKINNTNITIFLLNKYDLYLSYQQHKFEMSLPNRKNLWGGTKNEKDWE